MGGPSGVDSLAHAIEGDAGAFWPWKAQIATFLAGPMCAGSWIQRKGSFSFLLYRDLVTVRSNDWAEIDRSGCASMRRDERLSG